MSPDFSVFAPTMTCTADGYGLASSLNNEPFIEFLSRIEATDAFALLDDSYRIVRTEDGRYLAQTLVDRTTVANEESFKVAEAALVWVEQHFKDEFTRELTRYALTDEAIQLLADV